MIIAVAQSRHNGRDRTEKVGHEIINHNHCKNAKEVQQKYICISQ